MLIDQTHRRWLLVSFLLLVAGSVTYAWYAARAPNGPSGGSLWGLAYGIIGSAMMLFAGLLAARKRVPTWRIGSAQFWLRGHLWMGMLSVPFILFHSGFGLGGLLEQLLWLSFGLVVASGLFGLVMQHYLPRFMTARVPRETFSAQLVYLCKSMQFLADQSVAAQCGKLEVDHQPLQAYAEAVAKQRKLKLEKVLSETYAGVEAEPKARGERPARPTPPSAGVAPETTPAAAPATAATTSPAPAAEGAKPLSKIEQMRAAAAAKAAQKAAAESPAPSAPAAPESAAPAPGAATAAPPATAAEGAKPLSKIEQIRAAAAAKAAQKAAAAPESGTPPSAATAEVATTAAPAASIAPAPAPAPEAAAAPASAPATAENKPLSKIEQIRAAAAAKAAAKQAGDAPAQGAAAGSTPAAGSAPAPAPAAAAAPPVNGDKPLSKIEQMRAAAAAKAGKAGAPAATTAPVMPAVARTTPAPAPKPKPAKAAGPIPRREDLKQFYLTRVRPFLDEAKPTDRVLRDASLANRLFAQMRLELPSELHATLGTLEEYCHERREFLVQQQIHHWMHWWLIVHVPFTIVLAVFFVAHVVMALRVVPI